MPDPPIVRLGVTGTAAFIATGQLLITPALTQPGQAGDTISKSRLYGWLMPAYKDPHSSLLRQHLPHRDGSELAGAAERLGWASGKTATPWPRVPAPG